MTKSTTTLPAIAYERIGTMGHLASSLTTLELTLPAQVVQAVADHEAGFARLQQIRTAPAPEITTGDLLAEDYLERIDRHLIATSTTSQRVNVARKLLDVLAKRAERALRDAHPQILADLEAWFVAHHDDLATEGSPRQHPARAEAVTAQRQAFEQVHTKLVGQYTSIADNYFTPWFATYSWSAEAYRQLVDGTGPALSLQSHHNVHAAARDFGATPRLATSAEQIREAYKQALAGIDADDAKPTVDDLISTAAADGWAHAAARA